MSDRIDRLRRAVASVLALAAPLVVAIGVPHVAVAQEARDANAPPRGSAQFGVLWLKPGFRIPEIGVDTNVYNEAGQRDPDFVMVIQPTLDIGIATRRFDLTVTPNVGIVHFRNAKNQRSINPGVQAKTERRFSSRFALLAEGGAGSSRARVGLEVDARARQFSQGLTLGARLSGRKAKLELHASEAEARYEEEAQFLGINLAPELNRSSRAAGIGAGYRLSSLTTAVASVDVISDRFPRTPQRNLDSATVSGGFEFKPQALLSGTISGGYKVARPLRDGTPRYAGLTARGGLTLKVRDSFSLSGGLARDLDFSYRPDRAYFVYDLYEGSVRQALLRRLDIGVGMSSTKLNYRFFTFPDPPAVEPHVVEYLINTSASIGVTLLHGSRVGVYVSRWERFAGPSLYRSDRVGVQVAIGRANVNERGVFMNGPGR